MVTYWIFNFVAFFATALTGFVGLYALACLLDRFYFNTPPLSHN